MHVGKITHFMMENDFEKEDIRCYMLNVCVCCLVIPDVIMLNVCVCCLVISDVIMLNVCVCCLVISDVIC